MQAHPMQSMRRRAERRRASSDARKADRSGGLSCSVGIGGKIEPTQIPVHIGINYLSKICADEAMPASHAASLALVWGQQVAGPSRIWQAQSTRLCPRN